VAVLSIAAAVSVGIIAPELRACKPLVTSPVIAILFAFGIAL
jgi:hypothetical protein